MKERGNSKRTAASEKKDGNGIAPFLKGAAVIFVIFAVLFCIYPDTNVFTWLAARREIRSQKRQMRRYQLEIVDMQNKIERLTDDKDTLERFARESFHFAEPGEDVYLTDK